MFRLPHRLEERNHRLRSSVARNIKKTRKRPTTAAATSAVRAELLGADRATALGIEAHGPAPLLTLCRKLVGLGYDPALPLEAFRAGSLVLRVRAIGETSRLEVNGQGTGFRPATKPGRVAPMRQNLEAASEPASTRLGCGMARPTGWHQQTKTILNFAAAAAKRAARIAVTIGQKRRHPWPMSFSNTISTRLPKPISI